MIRRTKDRDLVMYPRPWIHNIINLDCVQGNANNLLATAMNLVKTFDKYFGNYVILETTNEELLNAS